MKKVYVILGLYLTIGCGVLFADWPCRTDSTVSIAVAPGNQWNVRLASDGQSGAILVWQDRRGGTIDKIYVQRVSSSGNPLWQQNGIPVAATNGYQYYPQIVTDGRGGAFIAWQDNRSGAAYNIYAQHVDANGNFLWTANGVLLSNSSGEQYNPQLTSDSLGGLIVTWQDNRSGGFDIYSQRVLSSGVLSWGLSGQVVCAATSDQIEPMVTCDGSGGAFIGWLDYRAGVGSTDVYCQHLSSSGLPLWQTDGIAVCNAPNMQWNLSMTPDGFNGVVLAWQDRRLGTVDNIYAQRINSVGTIQWIANGLQLASASGNQYYPQISLDGFKCYVATWQDNRNGLDYDIYAQRINPKGMILWSPAGNPICTSSGNQYNPQVVAKGSSVFFTWQDERGNDFDVYAQRCDLSGQPFWTVNGVGVAMLPMDQVNPQLVSDGFEGAVIAWDDYHLNTGSTDIFAHRIGANGLPAGGCFRSFAQDSFGLKAARFTKSNKKIIGIPNTGNVRDSLFARGVFPDGILIGIDRHDSSHVYGWIYFTASLYVRNALPQWATPRPLAKLLDKDFVGKLRNPTNKRYNNRLLGELLGLILNVGASDAGITQAELGDLVYHDTSEYAQLLNGRKLRDIISSVDSLMTYYRSYNNVNYSYIANALHNINIAFDGSFDTVSTKPIRIKSTRAVFSVPYLTPGSALPTVLPAFQPIPVEPDIANQFVLLQNYPNPFNPYTTIEFELPEAAVVTLKVYNILGQEVTTLFDHVTMSDGHQVLDYDASNLASGVYFYRMIAEPTSGKHIVSLVKKMMVVK